MFTEQQINTLTTTLTGILQEFAIAALAELAEEQKPARKAKTKTKRTGKAKTTRKAAPAEKPVKRAKRKAAPKVKAKTNWVELKLKDKGYPAFVRDDLQRAQVRVALASLTDCLTSTELKRFKKSVGEAADMDHLLDGVEFVESKWSKIWKRNGFSEAAAIKAFEAKS